MHHALIANSLKEMGPRMVTVAMVRATLGDWDAIKAMLPYVLPKASRASIPLTAKVDINVATPEDARKTLERLAAAIGNQEIGLEEGVAMMDVVGRALERITVVDMGDLVDRVEELENNPTNNVQMQSRIPVSRANGSTPKWGNIVKIDDLMEQEDG